MVVHGKEVEEEIFENEYKCFPFAKQVGYKQKHFFNLCNGFQVFFSSLSCL